MQWIGGATKIVRGMLHLAGIIQGRGPKGDNLLFRIGLVHGFVLHRMTTAVLREPCVK